jgi:hypothetical protein
LGTRPFLAFSFQLSVSSFQLSALSFQLSAIILSHLLLTADG